MLEVVEYYVKRALITQRGTDFRFSTELYSESQLADDVGEKLRLICGFRGGDPPPSVLEEERNGVPSYLLGYPLALAPKVIRYLFFVVVSPPVREADLVASHLRATKLRADRIGVPAI